MSYIRNKAEELTGYQCSANYFDKIDVGCDFVMVYRITDDLPERISEYRNKGYVIHLMTGISWGQYYGYLTGEWDGLDHLDESQTDRFGNEILHGYHVPYICPSIAFSDYLSEKLRIAVDAGVEAIHVEEPEFWDRAGYSEAFKREYRLFYREPWQPPHSDIDVRYKCARLKAWLFKRTIDRVSSSLKEYAMQKYGRVLRFYVPTHSLLNYTQWKIMSPESLLTDVSGVDGYIAQIWTGTSREPTCFNGNIKERTFETAYLEYGVMQELVKGTGRHMWFLHDPIEDNPEYDWNDYRYNYLKTVTASLLHPRINTYEICPWPNRVFDGKYPSDSPDAQPIPQDYASTLCGVFQTLGDMEVSEPTDLLRVGVLISDTALYQREYPDTVTGISPENITGTVLTESKQELKDFAEKLFTERKDEQLRLRFLASNAFPSFYGCSLPLLKYGMPVRPVVLDNVRRFPSYLDDCDVLVLSYEFFKPESPDINNALASWVRGGGQLIYIGDGSDPYHRISSWWSGRYNSPAEHLFEMLGVNPNGAKCVFSVGNGTVAVWHIHPATLCYSENDAQEYRDFFTLVLAEKGRIWSAKNYLIEKRGPYTVAAVFDESCSAEPLLLEGLFADMYTPKFDLITQKLLLPDDNALLFDFDRIKEETLRIIGTSVRVLSLEDNGEKINMTVHGASDINASIRVRVPRAVSVAHAAPEDGSAVEISCEYDKSSRTALLSFISDAKTIYISIN